MITRAQTDIMRADPQNAVVPDALPDMPYEPWASPVMVLAGAAPDGRPWLWLAARCGWFAGYAAQYDPDRLASAARLHREGCPECGEDA